MGRGNHSRASTIFDITNPAPRSTRRRVFNPACDYLTVRDFVFETLPPGLVTLTANFPLPSFVASIVTLSCVDDL